MAPNSTVSHISLFVSRGELTEALAALSAECPVGHPCHVDVIAVQARWNALELEYKRGLMARNEYEIGFNRTVRDIQDILSVRLVQPVPNPAVRSWTVYFIGLVVLLMAGGGFWLNYKNARSTAAQADAAPLLDLRKTPGATHIGGNGAHGLRPAVSAAKTAYLPGLGLLVRDDKGADDPDFTQKILAIWNTAQRQVNAVSSDHIKYYQHHLLGRWSLALVDSTSLVFGVKVISYQMTFLLEWQGSDKRMVCPPLILKSRVEANTTDSQDKIRTQAISDIIVQLKKHADYLDCVVE